MLTWLNVAFNVQLFYEKVQTEVRYRNLETPTNIMNRSTSASMQSLGLSGLLQHVDVGPAAQQMSRLATDPARAFDCVRFVLGELSTVKAQKGDMYHANICVS